MKSYFGIGFRVKFREGRALHFLFAVRWLLRMRRQGKTKYLGGNEEATLKWHGACVVDPWGDLFGEFTAAQVAPPWSGWEAISCHLDLWVENLRPLYLLSRNPSIAWCHRNLKSTEGGKNRSLCKEPLWRGLDVSVVHKRRVFSLWTGHHPLHHSCG